MYIRSDTTESDQGSGWHSDE